MGAIERVFRGRRGGQERPAAAIVAGLWRNGEQGVWYDPSDLSTMFQDATGTTPVTAPGHPVGLILDKRLGLARGPEKLLNSGFDSGATGWAISGQDATHIATFANSAVRYQSDTTSPALTLTSSTNMTVGATYEIVITLSNWVSGSLKTDSLQPLGTAVGLPFTFTGSGVYRFVGKAIAANFGILRGTTNVDLTIDSISVRELPGNHAVQPTTTSRPTYQVDANGCAYIAFDGVDDFMSVPGSASNLTCLHNGSGSTVHVAYQVSGSAVYHTLLSSGNLGQATNVGLSVSKDDRSDGRVLNVINNASAALHINQGAQTGVGIERAILTLRNASGVHELRKNKVIISAGTSEVGAASAAPSTYDLHVGKAPAAGLPLAGRIYALLIRGAISSMAASAAVEKLINLKARAY